MSELRVEEDSLDGAMTNTQEASDYAGNVQVSDGMGTVSSGMSGASAAVAASSAGQAVDDLAKKLASGLTEFHSALDSAKQSYSSTDETTSIDFTAFDTAMGES